MRITKRPDIQLNREELLAAAEDWHFDRGAFPDLQRMYRALLPLLETEVTVVWKPELLTAYCAVTLGAGIDRLQEQCSDSGSVSGAYMLECLGSVLLQKAYDTVDELLRENTGLFVQRYIFPGDGELPLSENARILERIREADAADPPAVSCNGSYVLTPQKSVVFVAVLGEDRRDRHLCDTCRSVNCPNRKNGSRFSNNP